MRRCKGPPEALLEMIGAILTGEFVFVHQPRSLPVIAYLRLLRFPNVFTALADVALGFALVRHLSAPQPIGLLVALLASSGFLYLAGMVLNDVWDVDIDRRERPERPIPSGQISLATANRLGIGLLIAGVCFGWLASGLFAPQLSQWWKCGAVATALAVSIVAYDRWTKHLVIGPLNMGLCRFLNVLLGASATAPVIQTDALAADHLFFGFDGTSLIAAAGLGIYIMGVTIFALKEAEDSRSATLLAGSLVMLIGLVVFGASPLASYVQPQRSIPWFWALLGLLSLAVFRRVFAALRDGSPRYVQGAIKEAILSLIMFDAALCLLYAPLGYAIAVVALIIPAVFLGRWVYST